MNNTSNQVLDISVQVTQADSEAIVHIAGRITIDSSPQLRMALLRLLGREAGTVVVIDLSKVPYLDTSGIATLLEGLKAAQERSVKLRLVGVSGRVRMLAELLELPKIFGALGSEVVFA